MNPIPRMPIRFLHIPKTAGTTFVHLLQRIYGRTRHFVFSGDMSADRIRLRAMTARQRQSIGLYSGHAVLHVGLADVDAVPAITFLRDPVERVKSFCQFVAEGKSPYLREAFPPDRFDLDRFLDSANPELDNLQTKMLILESAQHDSLPGDTEAERLALHALRNQVDAFGLLERFDESLLRFQARYRWPVPLYERLNEKDQGRLLCFETRHLQRIAELNRVDSAVYAAAKIILLQQLASEPVLNDQLIAFRHAQASAARGPAVFPIRKLLAHTLRFFTRKLRGNW